MKTILRDSYGRLKSCGQNYSGQLGDGTLVDIIAPVFCSYSYVSAFSAGMYFTMILCNDSLKISGKVWPGDTIKKVPTYLLNNVKQISAGYNHALICLTNDELYAFGENSGGQLGDGTKTNRAVPVFITDNVIDIDAGATHNLILKTDSTVWACGNNTQGQLGDGTTTTHLTPVYIMSNVKAISAGGNHSLFLKTDKTLWGCGSLDYLESTDRLTPIQINTVNPAM